MKSGYFTTYREKEEEITATLSEYRMRQIYQNVLKTIVNRKNQVAKSERVIV